MERAPSRLSGARIVMALAGVVLVGLLGWAAHSWSHPNLLGNLTSSGETGQTLGPPLALDTVYAGLLFPEAGSDRKETITFSSAKASVSSNSAGSTVAIAVCDRVPGASPIGTAASGNIAKFCSAVRPVADGTTLRLGDDRTTDYLLVMMTPTQAGSTQIDQVTYTYARGWKHFFQRGEDNAPAKFRLVVKP